MDFLDKKRKKQGKIADYSAWFHDYTKGKMDLQKVMNTQYNELDSAYSLLFNDIPDFKYLILNKRKNNNKHQSILLKYISDDSEKILNKAYTKINFMRTETKNMDKLNSLSLQKTSKSFFQRNRPKTSKLNNSMKNKEQTISTIFEIPIIENKNKSFKKHISHYDFNNNIFIQNQNVNTKLENKTDIKNINNKENKNESTKLSPKINPKKRNILTAFNKIKKINYFSNDRNKSSKKTNNDFNSPIDLFKNKGEEKYRKLINIDIPKLYNNEKIKYYNILKLNEDCRLQMKKTLQQYKIENHIKELNRIQGNNLAVRKSMEVVKYKINQKIEDLRRGKYYKKEYLKFKKENEKEKKENQHKKRDIPNKVRNISFKSEKKKKKDPYGYKKRALYDYYKNRDRIEKTKNDYLLKYGDQILTQNLYNKDYELINNSLDELFNALEIDSIVKYIDKFKNEKVCKNNDIFKERIKNYFPALTETEKNIQKIKKYQIEKLKKFEKEGWLNKSNENKLYNNVKL